MRLTTALLGGVVAFSILLPAMTAYAAPTQFNLPAQPLAISLKAAAAASGLTLTLPSDLPSTAIAPSLQGIYEPADALSRLLAGSDYTVSVNGTSAVVAKQGGDVVLNKVSVTATTDTTGPDGSAAAGYLVKNQTATGTFWGSIPLQDTPYTVNIVSAEMMQNLQVYDQQSALKYIPGIQTGNNAQNMTGTSSFTIRGFNFAGSSTSSGQTLEGMQNQGGFEFPAIEDKDRLEVISGLNGFMYGVGNVGGEINAVLKRPTDTPLYAVDLGDNAGANFYIHADLGGPVDLPGVAPGTVGYRLNVVEQSGDTSYDGQSVSRYFASGAIDVHATDNLLLQFNASTAFYALNGPTPFYILSSKTGFPALTQYPSPPDPQTLKTYGQAEHSDETDVAGVKATWTINDIFTLRSQYSFTAEHVNPDLAMYQKVYSDGTFQINPYAGGQSFDYQTHSGYAYLDLNFNIGDIQNKLTLGYNGFYQTTWASGNSVTWPATTYPYGNFYDQTASNFTLPSPVSTAAISHIQSHTYASNYMIGDAVTWQDFLLLVGVNDATWTSVSYNSSSVKTGGYNSSAATPAIALTYTVVPWVSTYVSYQESLQPGTVVTNGGGMIYTNAGAILPPYRGSQVEVGAKATLGTGLLATLALYNINKANLYTVLNPNGEYTYFEGGNIQDQGVELTLTGKVTPDLTLYGGATLENPYVHNNPDSPYQNGQLEQDASPISAKLYAEYNIPSVASADWLRAFVLTGGLSFTGPYHGNIRSSYTTLPDIFPGYAVIDLGFRYTIPADNHPLTLRFTVDNVADKGYWAATGLEGEPRTFLASIEAKW